MNKRKIINDPVYGFITIPYDSIYHLVAHPYFQRLRRIKQLGLTCLVYPGADHNRFQHALGAMHLMLKAIDVLKSKGVEVSEKEREAAAIAILLHDIGHGPFSHTLEQTLLKGMHHETLSLGYINWFTDKIDGPVEMAKDIFTGKYPKSFLHELVSSQLDVDRLDYLTRDSFYTGVSEGIVGLERIIMMMQVQNNHLVIEEKGMYSIEKFIVARRLMYWQVYLHKTAIALERWLISAVERIRWLHKKGDFVYMTPVFQWFMEKSELNTVDEELLAKFSLLDDSDIIITLKVAMEHPDRVLRLLANAIIHRDVPKIIIQKNPIQEVTVEKARQKFALQMGLSLEDIDFLVVTGSVQNEAYRDQGQGIPVLDKGGEIKDIAEASDNYSISALRDIVTKFYMITPREMI